MKTVIEQGMKKAKITLMIIKSFFIYKSIFLKTITYFIKLIINILLI